MVGVLPGLVVTKMMISLRNEMMMKIETMLRRLLRKIEQLHLRYSSIVPNISMVGETVGHVSVKCEQSHIGKI